MRPVGCARGRPTIPSAGARARPSRFAKRRVRGRPVSNYEDCVGRLWVPTILEGSCEFDEREFLGKFVTRLRALILPRPRADGEPDSRISAPFKTHFSLTLLSPCSVYRAATDPTPASPGGTASGGRKERPWPWSERNGARTRSDLLRGLLRLRVPHQEVDYEKCRRSRPAQILPRNPAQDQR